MDKFELLFTLIPISILYNVLDPPRDFAFNGLNKKANLFKNSFSEEPIGFYKTAQKVPGTKEI